MDDCGAGADGRIPLRLRIGVTGHRRLEDHAALGWRVRQVIDLINERVPSAPSLPIQLEVVSALAEGADRLVAEEVLVHAPGSILEVPLPLPVKEYCKDFRTVESQVEFGLLIDRAVLVIEAPPSTSREEAYERAGHYIVDRCDVLIALWDGDRPHGRGGTAYIVERARQRGMPLFWINSRRDYEITEERTGSIATALRAEARRYNERPIADFDAAVQAETRDLLPKNRAEIEDLGLEERAGWVMPYFVRADRLALHSQRRYFLGTRMLFGAAAIAVIAAAALAAFPGAFGGIEVISPLLEIAALAAVVVIYVIGTKTNVHPRWIWYRFLAERFRSAFFLALAGLGPRSEGGFDMVEADDASQDWAQRAFGEVWRSQPAVDGRADAADELRLFIGQTWLGPGADPRQGQIPYFLKQSRLFGCRHRRLTRAIYVLLGLTIAAAVAHVVFHFVVDDSTTAPSHISLFLSLSLPAVGAAIAGVAADREYHRHASRYERMATELTRIRSQLDGARTSEEIQQLTDKAEQTMLGESRDWFGIQRFHGFEPHV